MGAKYGVPYRGSKNKIARQIIDALPPADHFYDLFAGGCAIAHAAALSGKYRTIHINDINPLPLELFRNAIERKYDAPPRFVGREEFFRESGRDALTTYCWGFGNRPDSYMYSRKIEPLKRAIHDLIVGRNAQPLRERFGIDASAALAADDWRGRLKDWLKFARDAKLNRKFLDIDHLSRILRLQKLGESWARAQHLERRARLMGLAVPDAVDLVWSNRDYAACDIEPGAVIYCDIPYNNTDADYCNGFDRERFLDWAQSRRVYISECNIPENGFEVFREWQTTGTACATKTLRVTEKLFIPAAS